MLVLCLLFYFVFSFIILFYMLDIYLLFLPRFICLFYISQLVAHARVLFEHDGEVRGVKDGSRWPRCERM